MARKVHTAYMFLECFEACKKHIRGVDFSSHVETQISNQNLFSEFLVWWSLSAWNSNYPLTSILFIFSTLGV